MQRDSVSPFVAVLVGAGLVLVSEAQLHLTFHYYAQVYAIGIICLASGFVKAAGAIATPPARRVGSRALAVTSLLAAGVLTPLFALRAYALAVNMA